MKKYMHQTRGRPARDGRRRCVAIDYIIKKLECFKIMYILCKYTFMMSKE